jgi:cytochrome c-type biogenesis protein CcmE
MKISHIVGIVVIAIAIGVIVSTGGDASSYVNFSEAYQLAANGKNTKIHVVGELKKNADGEILGVRYNPAEDPNYFEFVLLDDQKRESKVIYFNPKPADFERSEKIVVVGSVKNNVFHADKILMKCPSKYQETEFVEAPKNI